MAQNLNDLPPVDSIGTPNPDAVARDEHVANVLRLRKGSAIAVVAWPLFGVVDWFIASWVHPGRLWFFLLLRAIGLAILLFGVLRIYASRLPGPTGLRIVDTLVCGSFSILVTISCYEFHGIASPLALGIVTIILARGAIVSDHWRRASVPIGLIAILHPITLIVMGAVSDTIAAQFADPELLASFVLNQTFVFGAAAITVAGGHLVWALKRQVFEQRSLGRYRLLHRIGAGGMGEVWRAHHHALKRDVAVKILRPENNGDHTAVARFEREVRATTELNHPHTVRVFDYGATEDGLWYYAMELLEGRDLMKLVQDEGALHPARAVKLMWQASKALAEAHERGITHRDIKPENLFVTAVGGEGDFIKVLDFGLAKLAEREGNPALTNAGWAVGTPKYVSPEVVFGNPADARSDVYGLGAVLYFALCAAPPFDYDDMRQTLMAHMNETPLPPSQRAGRPIPRAIEAVVMRCLDKEPGNRYASAAELAFALEDAAAESGEVKIRQNRRRLRPQERPGDRRNSPPRGKPPLNVGRSTLAEPGQVIPMAHSHRRTIEDPFPHGSERWDDIDPYDTVEEETQTQQYHLPVL